MFTGIVEANSKIIEIQQGDQSLQIQLARPVSFDDIKIGDSVACNGVCLTVEAYDKETMKFTVGHETLQVTGWSAPELQQASFNLERSLRFGDRIHGHLVSGHVDAVSTLKVKEWAGDCLLLTFQLPAHRRNEIWEKSSVAINGVSLTVNWVDAVDFQVCLIPETLRQTNMDALEEGQTVNIETDYYMKGLLKSQGVQNA